MYSRRTGWDLAETAYAAAVREAREAGRTLLDLTGSNPTRCGIAYDRASVMGPLADAEALEYDPEPRGLLAARDAVSEYYADHGADVGTDQLILTASTSESYSFLFQLLCDPGDEVLFAQPSYPLFDFLAALDDLTLLSYPVFHDHGWWIDFAELERRIGPRTRAIVVVNPNNPTGHWTSEPERERLREICARCGLALIVDEVFLDYPLAPEGGRGRSFASGASSVSTFVLSGLSKVVGLPQMKAAWIAALGPDPERTQVLERLEVIADTFLSVSSPVQLAMPSWLRGRGAIQGQVLERIRGNLQLLEEFAARCPDRLHVLAPAAGWSAVLSLPGCGGNEQCAERLVRERGVVVHPGSFYGMAGANRAVVSLLTPPAVLVEAVGRL